MALRDFKKRQVFIQYLYRKRYFKVYNFYLILKLLIKNNYVEKQFKVLAIFLLTNLHRFNYISYHKNICLMTGCKRSVFNFFKMNRMSVLDNLNKLDLPGINKTI